MVADSSMNEVSTQAMHGRSYRYSNQFMYQDSPCLFYRIKALTSCQSSVDSTVSFVLEFLWVVIDTFRSLSVLIIMYQVASPFMEPDIVLM